MKKDFAFARSMRRLCQLMLVIGAEKALRIAPVL